MMKLTENQKKRIDSLLSADENIINKTLSELDNQLASAELRALEMLWQLHENEELKEKAEVLIIKMESGQNPDRIKKAFELFRSLNEILPWSDENAASKQLIYFTDFIKVFPEYEELFASHPYYTEILLDAGRKLYMLFKLEPEAEIIFSSIAKFNPNNDEAVYALGRIEEKKGNFDKALECYEKAIALNESNNFANMQAGILKSTVFDRQEEAIAHFNKVIEDDPYSVEPYIRIAEAAYSLNDIPRSRQYLDIALSINEYNEEALNLLGIIQWKVDNNPEKAIETFQKGIDHKIHNDSALLLKSLGDIYTIQLQDFKKGRVFYEKSLNLNPAQKEILSTFVPILLKNFQDLDAIAQCYDNFIRIAEDSEVYSDYADFLAEYLHDYETAAKYLKKALELKPDNISAQKFLNRINSYLSEDDELEDEIENAEDIDIEIEFYDEDDDDDDDDDDFSGGSAAGDN